MDLLPTSPNTMATQAAQAASTAEHTAGPAAPNGTATAPDSTREANPASATGHAPATTAENNTADTAPPPPYIRMDSFLPEDIANGLRQDLTDHFKTPYKVATAKSDIWKYFFVTNLFTYLKAKPERIFDADRYAAFTNALRAATIEKLGTAQLSIAHLNYFFPGCYLEWHTDTQPGCFAFVYSLTADARRSQGGQTLIMRDLETISATIAEPRGGTRLYHRIEPRFNRLLLIDQRSPHAVRRIDGSMDPADGRFVLQGRIDHGPPVTQGALTSEQVAQSLAPFAVSLAAQPDGHPPCHGPFGLKLDIDSSGAISKAQLLHHRIRAMDGTAVASHAIAMAKLASLRAVRFPAAAGPSVVRYMSVVGAPVRDIVPAG